MPESERTADADTEDAIILAFRSTAAHAERAKRAEQAAQNHRIATLELLSERGTGGATWREVGAHLGVEHQTSSAVLSGLHKELQIYRLHSVSRRGCGVYVLPRFVVGRAVAKQGYAPKRALCPNCSTEVVFGEEPVAEQVIVQVTEAETVEYDLFGEPHAGQIFS